MANFLRDQFLINLTLDEDTLKQLDLIFKNRLATINTSISENDDQAKKAILTYIIRFDNKGYRVFNFENLLQHLHQAKEIERIIFTIETGESLRSGRLLGTCMELKFDEKDPRGCFLMVTSDNNDWVNSSFSVIQDVLGKCKNKNGWMQTAWTQLVIQILGISLVFFLSLWVALKIAPKLLIENSFIICFLFILLVLSNFWSHVNKTILSFINKLFPNLKFSRPKKDRLHWLMQGIIVTVVCAVTITIFLSIVSHIGNFIVGLISKN